MTELRKVEGIGYHDASHEADCLLVEKWLARPDDLKGQMLNISRLLPANCRCAALSRRYPADYPEDIPPRKFWFRITVETDDTAADKT